MEDGSRAVAENGGIKLEAGDHLPGLDPFEKEPGFSMPHASTSPPVQASDIGSAPVAARLRAAREALGLSVKDIAQRTRVTLRHIEALEAGDYAAMPGRPYAIGFARGYALVVGLDGTAIADAVRSELQGRAPRPEPRVLHQFEVGDPSKTPSRPVVWLALLVAVGILAMGAVFWRSYYAPAVDLPSLAGPTEAEGPASAQTRAAVPVAPSANQSGTGPVIFTALEEGIWVKFYDGQGKQLMQKQLAKGESYTVPADAVSPKIWTGRPDALAITIGGQASPRLAESEGIIKDVPVDAASLRTRAQAAGPGAAPAPSPSAASIPTAG